MLFATVLNPFDETVKSFFESHSRANIGYAKEIIQQVNKKWGTDITFEQARESHCLIKNSGSSGFF